MSTFVLDAEYAAHLLPVAPRSGLRTALSLASPRVTARTTRIDVDDELARRLDVLCGATALLTVLLGDGGSVHDWTFAIDGVRAVGVRRVGTDLQLGEPTTVDDLVALLAADLGAGDGATLLATGELLGELRRTVPAGADEVSSSSEGEPGGDAARAAALAGLVEARLVERRDDGAAALAPGAASILPAALAPSWKAVVRRELDPPCPAGADRVVFVGPAGHRVTVLATQHPDLMLLADESLERKSARLVAICAPWIYEVPCRLAPGDACDAVLDALRAGSRAKPAAAVTREVRLTDLLDERLADPGIALLRSAPVAFRLAARDCGGDVLLRCAGAADASRVVLFRSRRPDGGTLVETGAAGFAGVVADAMGFELDGDGEDADDFTVAIADLLAAGPQDIGSVEGLPPPVAAALAEGWRWCSAETLWRRSPTGHASTRVTWLAAAGRLWSLNPEDEQTTRCRSLAGRDLVDQLLDG